MKKLKRKNPAAVLGAAVATALLLSACGGPDQGDRDMGDGEVPSSVKLVVPYAAGGGTDTWARFMAPYLESHVEGEPRVLVENVPGGESVTGSNEFVHSGGANGESLLVTSGTTYFQALLGQSGVEFDFAKMRPLMLNGTGGVVYVSSTTGIQDVQDLADYAETLTYGGISATGLDLTLLQAMDVLGVDVDATFGFEGRGPARLALERGEVNMDYQTTSAYQTQVEPLVDEGKAVPLFSFGVLEDGEVVRDPALPDLPTLEEAYEQIHGEEPSGQGYEAYRAFLVPGYVYQKGIWVNEDTPDSIVHAFHAAAGAIAADEDFQEKSHDILGGYPLVSGEEAQDELRESFEISDEVRQYTLDLLEEKHDVTVSGE
ncbi:Bug family tripartite tricarboxylate transporter substrate binding protein [Zhihengliuella halotolerans]|uniref:Tripartite-type tricarboxylate transporter receptor subunit TctC n=1 Tax=Zhihengliuella halotolerans TaxID=370736 RepID=A0A4Q8AFD8_9MICC|nr:tripartite tricarboxylate transporter substrate-binding protein [Zhihengliuella halotolerans]RZU63020.1 tripartite-type tricarboxylate transporter receptor subunit TctC [Zhihengliuella halotolerans]